MIPSGDTENYEVDDLLEPKRRHWLYRRMVLPVLFCIAFFVVLIWWFRYIDMTEESRRVKRILTLNTLTYERACKSIATCLF